MTRSLLATLVVGLSLMLLSACGETEFVYNSASFFKQDYETSYTKISDCTKSPTHGGDYVKVFADSNAAQAYSGGDPVKEGGVVVKPQYADDGCTELTSIKAMRKGPAGTAPDKGDWEWQDVGEDGSISSEGQLGGCISCHTGCPLGDFRCQE